MSQFPQDASPKNITAASRDGHPKSRPWRVVAAEASGEQDPKKLDELVGELNQALDEQGIDGKPKIKRDAKVRPDGE